MKRFIKEGSKFFTLLLIPALLLLGLYLYFDPFKVVHHYSTFFDSPVPQNRDFVSTEVFLQNKDKYNYNSFIFGSSRAISFNPAHWAKYLDDQAVPFVYDASGESLFGIYTKLQFLERENVDIKNVLILFCRGAVFNRRNYTEHLVIKHPIVTGESQVKFHLTFLKAYSNLKFLLGYYSYLLTKEHNPFTKGVIQVEGISIDYRNNHIKLDTLENQLSSNPVKYYEERSDIFYKRLEESYEHEPKFGPEHFTMLMGIKEILQRNGTNYRIILTPTYDQVKFSPEDKEMMVNIFRDRLFDFTGRNFITEIDTNWYETDHFRPFIADSIMSIIYSADLVGNKWR